MKHVLAILTVLFFSLTSFSGTSDNEYKKIAEHHDVPQEAKVGNSNYPAEYWRVLLKYNNQLHKFVSDMQKNRGAEKEALSKIADVPRFYARYNASVLENMQGYCDTLLMEMGISELDINCSLHIVQYDEVNAYCVLTEDGFAMCVTTGLLKRKGFTRDLLIGVVSHEFAHGIYHHALQQAYAEAKKNRQYNIFKIITIGMDVATSAANLYFASKGAPAVENPGVDLDAMDNDIKKKTELYSIAYSREQEYEADIVAYRFLQWIGKEDVYTELLRFLSSEYDLLYTEYSDHPTINSRLGLIKYLGSHPEISNKEIERLRRLEVEDEIEKKRKEKDQYNEIY
ncbi:MAG: M48 family metalloprotease [Muribaculaceae bacterium]|nr:M48 family metalloprotease [Muribaculaceae bacterium]